MANFCNNCSGCNGCGSAYNRGRGYRRNTYAALNTLPRCSACLNYPYYTGRCPDECGCYNYGCNAGVSTQNTRSAFYNNCAACAEDCCCDNNAHGNTCGCHTGCDDGCNGCAAGYTRGNTCAAGYVQNGSGCHTGCDNGCSCGCGNGGTCDCALPAPIYGMFTASAPLTVTSGAGIPLVSGAGTGDFTVYSGNITLQQPGVYLATITLQMPGDTAADGVLNLNLNGSPLPAARIALNFTTSDGNAATYSSQTIFTAAEGAMLSLTPDSSFSIPGVSGQTLITLTLVKLGD